MTDNESCLCYRYVKGNASRQVPVPGARWLRLRISALLTAQLTFSLSTTFKVCSILFSRLIFSLSASRIANDFILLCLISCFHCSVMRWKKWKSKCTGKRGLGCSCKHTFSLLTASCGQKRDMQFNPVCFTFVYGDNQSANTTINSKKYEES